METRQQSAPAYHRCSCGECFESTEELLAHARSEHGMDVR